MLRARCPPPHPGPLHVIAPNAASTVAIIPTGRTRPGETIGVVDKGSVAQDAYRSAAQRVVALLSALQYGESVDELLDEMNRREMSMSLAVAVGYLSDMLARASQQLDMTFGEYLGVIGVRLALDDGPAAT